MGGRRAEGRGGVCAGLTCSAERTRLRIVDIGASVVVAVVLSRLGAVVRRDVVFYF